MEKKISYLNRTFADYKEALIEMSKRFYPDLTNSFEDSSIAEWQIDMTADIADNLSYHIDRAFQETNINSAQEKSSLYAMARNSGVKIPGPKGAMAEVRITLVISGASIDSVDTYGPVIKKGTKFSSGSHQFELTNDVDFSSQFDINGNSDRTIVPRVTTNGVINGYTVSKLAVVVAGETRIFSQVLRESDIKPFMEIMLPIENVMNIESILVVDGTGNAIPTYGSFYGDGCSNGSITRFYEVDNLAQNKCWLDASSQPEINKGSEKDMPYYHITKGEWKPIKHKFITEYTDKGYLKVIFGCGNGNDATLESASNFNKWQMTRLLNNNNLGVLPKANTTLHILYRVGGGSSSNVAKGAINKISYLNADFKENSNVSEIMKSLRVENTTPSTSGKDMPNENEMRYYIKYHNAAQERCVTVKDYIDRLLLLPPKYGTPFRVGVTEENNKIVIYLLGINDKGKLTADVPTMLVENIKNYLSEYKVLGDFIEIKPGKVINIGVDVEAIVDKNYNEKDVIAAIIRKVEEYMDVNRHMMGEEIYVGDLQKEIGKIDGVINLINLKIKNKHGEGYSSETISQPVVSIDNNVDKVDLEASDWILYNDGDSMMEILKEEDIKVRIKLR